MKKVKGTLEELFSRQKEILAILSGKEDFQEILQKKRVLIAGAGGLGCAVAEGLARLGIGKIFIIDKGKVDLPDLNRQIFYGFKDLGKKKAELSEMFLRKIGFGEILGQKIKGFSKEISENFEFEEKVDLVIDALDNWKARAFLDEFCEKKEIPLVHGGLNSFFGQITTIYPGKTKRLREIFKRLKDEEGIIPAFSGICFVVAGLQVVEALKLLTGSLENALLNRLLLVDLLNYSFEIIQLR